MQLIAEVYDLLHRGARPAGSRARRHLRGVERRRAAVVPRSRSPRACFERRRSGDRQAARRPDPRRGAAEGHRQVDEPERVRRRRADSDGQRRGRGAHPLGAEDRARGREPGAARPVAARSAAIARRLDRRRAPGALREQDHVVRAGHGDAAASPRRNTTTTSIRARSRKIWRAGCIIRAACSATSATRSIATRRSSTCCSTTRSATRSPSAQDGVAARRADGGRPRHSGAGDGRVARLLRRVPQRAAAGQSHPGAARLLRRAHLPPRRSRRRVSHGLDRRRHHDEMERSH